LSQAKVEQEKQRKQDQWEAELQVMPSFTSPHRPIDLFGRAVAAAADNAFRQIRALRFVNLTRCVSSNSLRFIKLARCLT
jgi:hypothetical protein